jgi:hypothetical protein
MDDRIESLARRVERLERSNLVLKIVNVGVVAAVVAMAQLPSILALTPVKVVSAQKFNLVTAGGITIASLAPSPGGSALTFYDSGGHPTVAVGMQADGVVAGIETFDGNTYVPGTGKTRAVLGETNTDANGGGIGAAVFDPNEKVRLTLGTARDASTGSSFLVYDTTGTLRAGVDVDLTNNYEGFFTRYAVEPTTTGGSILAGSSVDTSIGPFVGIYDPNSTVFVRAFMGFGSNAWPSIFTSDSTYTASAGVSTDQVHNFNGFFNYDKQPQGRAFFGSALDGTLSFMTLHDSAGVQGPGASVAGNASNGGFSVADASGRPMIGMGGGRKRTGSGAIDCSADATQNCFGFAIFDIAGTQRVQPGFDLNDESFGFTINTATDVSQVLATESSETGGSVQTFDTSGTQTGHVP